MIEKLLLGLILVPMFLLGWAATIVLLLKLWREVQKELGLPRQKK